MGFLKSRSKVAVCVFVAASAITWTATSASAAVDEASSVALQQDLDAVVSSGSPGAVATLADGDAAWSGASGVSDTASGTPTEPHDQFRIGSATKPMVAIAFMQLVEQGRADLDSTVAEHLGDVVPYADQITVRQLLSHRSGIPNYTAKLLTTPEQIVAAQNQTWTAEQLIAGAVEGEPASKTPGTFEYSNTNYVVAGEILEKITGQPLSELLRHEIFLPAGMNSTIYRQEDPVISGAQMRGYVDAPGDGLPAEDTTRFNPSFYQGAGAVISTSADLARFFDALTNGELVSKATFDAMLEGTNANSEEAGDSYGLGLYVLPSPCAPEGKVVAHDGSVFGYSTFVASTLDGQRQVAVGSNAMAAIDPAISKEINELITENICSPGSQN